MKNIKNIFFLSLFFIVLYIFYIAKIPATYIADDSPECIISFQTLGIQHPPGYPLSSLMGKIFLLFPIGNIMFRAIIMSMIFNIFTAFIIFFIIKEIFIEFNKNTKINIYYSFFAALLYLFSNTVFLHGFSAKGSIYTIQAFIVAIIFLSLLNLKKNYLFLYLIGFILGISAGNHLPSSIAILPAIIIAIYFQKKVITSKRILYFFLFIILGMSILIYLPIRSKSEPVLFWGPINNINEFVNYLFRQRYFVVEHLHTMEDTVKFLNYYFSNILPEQYPFFIFYIMIPGAIMFLIKNRYIGLVKLIALIGTIGAIAAKVKITSGLEFIVKPYLIFTYIFSSIFIAYFFYYIIILVKNKIFKNILFYCLPFFILCLIIFKLPDYSRYFLAYDYSKNLFLTIPKNSVYFAEGDLNINSVIYLDLIENKKVNYVISIFLEDNWYRDKLKLNKNIIVPDSYIDLDDYIGSIMFANKHKNVLYSNAFTKSFIHYPVLVQGITHKIIFDNNKNNIDPYLFFKLYSFRGVLEKKINYDDATRVFVLEAYGKCLVKIAKIFEQNNEEQKAHFFYTRAFNFYKNDILAVKLALYYLKNFQYNRAKYYLQQALRINKNNQNAKNLLLQL